MDGGSVAIPLFLIFLILKLTGVIAWSWWWVTAPLWIDAILVVGFISIAFTIAAVTRKRISSIRFGQFRINR